MAITIEQRNEKIGDKTCFKQVCFTAETVDEAEYLEHVMKVIEHKNNIQSIIAKMIGE